MKATNKELQNTTHSCKNMGLWKEILIKHSSVWELEENSLQNRIVGERQDWKICPYCGINFYEDESEENK